MSGGRGSLHRELILADLDSVREFALQLKNFISYFYRIEANNNKYIHQ
jgi:hypothetical protein